MSHAPIDPPERLLDGGATEFERRILEAAAGNKPSPETSARMARALGVTATGIGAVAVGTKLASDAAVAKATTAAGTTVLWPWVSAGVLGLVIAGAVVGTRAWQAAPTEARPALTPVTTPALLDPAPSAPPNGALGQSLPAGPSVTSTSEHAVTRDLRDQIALIDAARTALSSGAGRRALEILRRYQDGYPAGSFRPEAAALKVEALVKLGREAEARALAERFVAEHRGSLLAERVAKLAGLGSRARAEPAGSAGSGASREGTGTLPGFP
jgi:hypothetical protein